MSDNDIRESKDFNRKVWCGLNILCPSCGGILMIPPDMIGEKQDSYGSLYPCRSCGKTIRLVVEVDTGFPVCKVGVDMAAPDGDKTVLTRTDKDGKITIIKK